MHSRVQARWSTAHRGCSPARVSEHNPSTLEAIPRRRRIIGGMSCLSTWGRDQEESGWGDGATQEAERKGAACHIQIPHKDFVEFNSPDGAQRPMFDGLDIGELCAE